MRDETHAMNEAHKLMSEVLPAPSAPFGGASPRARTLAKMERLLSLAATSAAIGGCSSASSPAQPVVDIPPAGSGGPLVVAGTNTTPPPPKASASATDEPSLDGPIGYAVVDPLPPPAICAGVAPTIKATATWKQDKSGMVIELALPKPGFSGSSYVVGSPPMVYGATVLHTKAAADSVLLRLAPSPGTTNVGVSLVVQCPPGQSKVSVNIEVKGPGQAGATLGTSLYDRW